MSPSRVIVLGDARAFPNPAQYGTWPANLESHPVRPVAFEPPLIDKRTCCLGIVMQIEPGGGDVIDPKKRGIGGAHWNNDNNRTWILVTGRFVPTESLLDP